MESGWMAAGASRVEAHDRIPSTNDRLRELAREGAPPFTVVLAREQTEGRGRRGRRWASARDAGLWVSVLLPPPPGGPPGVVTLLVGLAAARAIEAVAGVRVGLKWPNDLFVRRVPGTSESGKVAGVLCEVAGPAVAPRIVAGVGVNLRRPAGAAEEGALKGASFLLESAGEELVRDRLAEALLVELRRWVDPPSDRLEPGAAAEWEARDLLYGEWVVPEFGPAGTGAGITSEGGLRVRAEDGGVHEVGGGSVLPSRALRLREG